MSNDQLSQDVAPRVNSERSNGRTEAVFVYAVWALLLVAAFWFARTYGNPIPFVDEWVHVSILAGTKSVSKAWLWEPHGEHRIPLAKLAWVALIKWTDSFKVGVYLNVLLLGMLALALLRTTQIVCGGSSYTDAIIPILLLHLGQGYNLQWWWQIMQISPTVVLGILIIAVVRGGPDLSPKWALVAGGCLIVLPFCGPSGLPAMLAMSLWLGVWCVRALNAAETSRRRMGFVVLAMVLAAMAFLGLYFWGLEKPEHMPPSPGLDATLRTAVQFVAVSAGAGANYAWEVKAALIGAFLAGSVLVLVVGWYRWPVARFRITGLLLLTSAIVPLALGLGWGRAYHGERAGLSHWYAIFGVPALLSGYFAWRLYAPTVIGQLVRVTVFAATCMILAFNLNYSLDFFSEHHQKITSFMKDLNDGTPLPLLADRHVAAFFGPEHAGIFWEESLSQLYDAGYPVLRPLNVPRLVEGPAMFSFKRAHQATWRDGVLTAIGNDPFVVFALDEPQFVYAIRLIFSYESARNPEACEFYWQSRGAYDFGSGDRVRTWQQNTTQKPCSRTILVDEVIDEFRIDPGAEAAVFRLEKVALLVQDTDPPVRGAFDTINDGFLSGWVWDKDRPDESLQVDIFDGDTLVVTVTANELREDLRAGGFGTGRYGFTLPTPAILKDGQSHRVQVVLSGTKRHVPGSPKRYVRTAP